MKKRHTKKTAVTLSAVLFGISGLANGQVFDVNSTEDAVDSSIGDGFCATISGSCTLRAAIQESNALAGEDTINLPAGSYNITLNTTNEDESVDGDFDIRDDLIITGADRTTTIISSGYSSRLFHIVKRTDDSRPVVFLSQLTLAEGSITNGAGIYNDGSLTLSDVDLLDNEADEKGGAIYSSGKLKITNAQLKGNSAQYGGGIYQSSSYLQMENSLAENNTTTKQGGAIYFNNSTAKLTNSHFLSNTALAEGGGLSIQSSVVHIESSTLESNSGSSGGAISCSWSTLHIQNSDLKLNQAKSYNGGGISGCNNATIFSSNFLDNVAVNDGGAISGSNYVINNVLFRGNSASPESSWGDGGAIYGGGHQIYNSSFSNNTAVQGGGAIYGSSLLIENSLFEANRADFAGAIYTDDSQFNNVTISGNTAITNGGGIYEYGHWNKTSLTNVTLAFNQATTGGNLYVIDANADAQNELKNTIISDAISGGDCSGTAIKSKGNNLDSDGSCNLSKSSDKSSQDPLLAILADNGGSTKTHALQAGSPAIDSAYDASCADVDQRFYLRNSPCDMGAYEANSSAAQTGNVAFEYATYSANEASGLTTVIVARTGGSEGKVSVEFYLPVGSTATNKDFQVSSSPQTLVWEDGMSDNKVIEITLTDDSDQEGDETVRLGLRNPIGGAALGTNSNAVLTIIDDDIQAGEFSFSQNNYDADENAGSVPLTINRDNGSFGEVSVEVVTGATGDSATEPDDYTFTSETVTFAAGDTTSKTVSVSITDDAVGESEESFTVSLQNASGGAAIIDAMATVTIQDNDSVSQPGTLQFQTATYQANEASGTVQLTVSRTGGSDGVVSVSYATAIGSAGSSDFTAKSGTLTFTDGVVSQSINIVISDDTLDEGDEIFSVTLSSASGASLGSTTTATVTIQDNDTATPSATLQFQSATYQVSETSSIVQLTVTRTGSSDGKVSVNYATATGSAGSSDFTAKSGTLTFYNGVTSQIISIFISKDTLDEGDETFSVTLNSASGASLGTTTTATVTIQDDDGSTTPTSNPGTLSFEYSSYSVSENVGTVTITVNRTGGSDGVVSVGYRTSDLTAQSGSDYMAISSGLLTFSDGQTSAEFTVSIADDSSDENNEQFKVWIENPTGGASLGTNSQATVTIIDNDTAPSNNGNGGGTTTPDSSPEEDEGGGGPVSPWLWLILTLAMFRSRRRVA